MTRAASTGGQSPDGRCRRDEVHAGDEGVVTTHPLLKLGKAGHSAGPIGGDIFVASRGSTSVIATWCSD